LLLPEEFIQHLIRVRHADARARCSGCPSVSEPTYSLLGVSNPWSSSTSSRTQGWTS
jgi:hypothetical protein